jgi:hypothetical protein
VEVDRLELEKEDERLLEIELLTEDDRLDELTTAGAELERLEEATINDDWLDDEIVAALKAAISFLILLSAWAA